MRLIRWESGGGVADEGNACEEVLADVKSANRFHLETPGPEATV
jgi:hypothetical protein